MADYIKDLRNKIGNIPILVPAATAIIYKDGKVLLQKRASNKKWATHGGCIELGETVREALERELMEEINIKPINPRFAGVFSGKDIFCTYPNGDNAYFIISVFIVEDYETINKENDGEVLELKWFNVDELPKDIHEPDIPILRELKNLLQGKEIIK